MTSTLRVIDVDGNESHFTVLIKVSSCDRNFKMFPGRRIESTKPNKMCYCRRTFLLLNGIEGVERREEFYTQKLKTGNLFYQFWLCYMASWQRSSTLRLLHVN